MTAKELRELLPYTDGDKMSVVIATDHDEYGMGRQIIACLEDKANNTIILVCEDIKTRGVKKSE